MNSSGWVTGSFASSRMSSADVVLAGDDAGRFLLEPRGFGRFPGLEALRVLVAERPHQIAGAS